jgi:nucleotide-binding universal stress UspA family protein
MLSSIFVKNDMHKCERIMKLGDSISKIVEAAEWNHAELIILGARELGNTASNLGSISCKVEGRKDLHTSIVDKLD